MSFLGKLFARGIENDDDAVVLRPGKQFTTKDIQKIAERGATEFRRNNLNLLSCYGPLDGEFGLYETLSNFVTTKNPMTADINEAIADGDEIELLSAFQKALAYSFVTLCEKNAIKRLQLVDVWPPEAVVEYARMRSVVATKAASATPVVAPAPVRETPVDPVTQCASDFRSMGSNQFRRMYIADSRRRSIYDQAVDRGLL